MTRVQKIILMGIAVFLILIASIVWLFPTHSYAYSGSGETYDPSSSEASSSSSSEAAQASTSSPSTSTSDEANKVSEAAEETMSGLKGFLDKAAGNANKIYDNSDYDQLLSEHKDPAIFKTIEEQSGKMLIVTTSGLITLWNSFAGLIIVHGLLGISIGGYYEYFSKMKISGFIHSVALTRDRFGMSSGNGSGTTQTTTSNKDGSVTTAVTNVAKSVSGPLPKLLFFVVNSIIEIAASIVILILIRVGIIPFLLNSFIQLLISGANMLFSFGK